MEAVFGPSDFMANGCASSATGAADAVCAKHDNIDEAADGVQSLHIKKRALMRFLQRRTNRPNAAFVTPATCGTKSQSGSTR